MPALLSFLAPRIRLGGALQDVLPGVGSPSAAAPRRSGAALTPLLVTLAFTLAAMLALNPYQFGVSDNSITVPMVRSYVDPQLYPGDFMVGQREFYYTYLWPLLAWMHLHLGPPIRTLYLAWYGVALFATFLAVHLLAWRLFRSMRVAVLAQSFLLFQRPTLAGIDTVENILNTREVALPLVLFALWLALDRRIVWAYVLLGIGYLVHPLTIHPAVVMVTAGALANPKRVPWRSLALGGLAFALLASPVLLWKLAHTPASLRLFAVADPRWLQALRLRSPHHMFPSEWGASAAFHAVLVLGLVAITWVGAAPARPEDRRQVLAWSAAVVVVCAAGAFFAEVVPIGAAFVFQPLRAFQFLEFFAIFGVARVVIVAIDRARHPIDLAPAVIAGCTLLYGVPNQQRPTALFLAMAATLAFGRLRGRPIASRRFVVVTVALVAIAGTIMAARAAHRGDVLAFSASNAQDPSYLDVQRWARDHTAPRDAFIVPPQVDDEFRVRSQRTVYADWEDGGLMNANPAYGIEWLRRMRALGFHAGEDIDSEFRPPDAVRLRRIAAEMSLPGRRVFFVSPASGGARGFPVRYRNSAYLVGEVVDSADDPIARR